MDLADAQKLTAKLSRELDERAQRVQTHQKYLSGESGQLKFASAKFKEYFDKQFNGFADNWCLPVAQAPAERMRVLGLRPYEMESGVDKDLGYIWAVNDAEGESSGGFLSMAATGYALTLVHPDGTGPDGMPGLTWEKPETAIVDTDPVTRRDRAGLVAWRDDRVDYATLYTPDWICKFKRETNQERFEQRDATLRLSGGWVPRTADPSDSITRNPLGEVPLTELRNQSILFDEPISDISGVMALQDAANLVWAYLLNGLDQASLAARVVTGADLPKTPVLDKNGQVVGYQDVPLDELMKERILWIPGSNSGSDVKIEEWSAANLEAFSNVIERIVEHIAAQTRTPPHYLVAKMVNTAAESLNIAEAGLVSKTRERTMNASRGLKKTFRLMARARGLSEDRVKAISAGNVIWDQIQYRSESQMADVVTKLRAAGFPLEYIVERIAQDPAEVKRIMAMAEKERELDPLQSIQRVMQQGEGI